MVFYLLCGAPFSGKTTVSKLLSTKTGAVILSLDDLMKKKGFDLSNTIAIEEWENAHQEALKLIEKYSELQQDVILDDTNFLKKLRDRFSNKATSVGYDVKIIYLEVGIDTLEQRRKGAVSNKERNTLSDEAFYSVINNFEVPGSREDAITIRETDDIIEQVNKITGY